MKRKKECDVLKLYKLLGKKWTIELFFNIDDDPASYNQLFSLFGHTISPTLLSKRLKELSDFNLINKKNVSWKNLYIITTKGEELKNIILKSKIWLYSYENNIPKECIKDDKFNCCYKKSG